MKKYIALFVVAIMLFSLSSCGSSESTCVNPESITVLYNGEEVRELELDMNDYYPGEELTITAVCAPEGAGGETGWKSSDKDVVKVKDNGDGSCTLRLCGVGDAMITASCGEVRAEVSVSVINSAVWEKPLAEFTVSGSANEAGAPLTPDDVLNAGILSLGDAYRDRLDSFFSTDFIEAGEIDLGHTRVAYETRAGRFIRFGTEAEGKNVSYSVEYTEEGFVTGFTADFGGKDVSTVSIDAGKYGINSIKSSGYGGETEVHEMELLSVDGTDGGFTVYANGPGVEILIGCNRLGGSAAMIALTLTGDGNLHIDQVIFYDASGIKFIARCNEQSRFAIKPLSALLPCRVNGNDAAVSYYTDGSCSFFSCFVSEGTDMYYLHENSGFTSCNLCRDTGGILKITFISADGREWFSETPYAAAERGVRITLQPRDCWVKKGSGGDDGTSSVLLEVYASGGGVSTNSFTWYTMTDDHRRVKIEFDSESGVNEDLGLRVINDYERDDPQKGGVFSKLVSYGVTEQAIDGTYVCRITARGGIEIWSDFAMILDAEWRE